MFALLACAWLSPALAQEAPSSVRIDTSLVLVDGIVMSKKTHSPVGDLKKQDFVIYDNGRLQEITHFSREELPLSVILLVDVSGSVQPIIDQVRQATLDALKRLKPEDRVGLMIFANRAKVIADLTTEHGEIETRFDDVWRETQTVGSGTFITLGIYDAARYLREKTSGMERRAIILITDDEDFRYSFPPRDVVLRELYDSGTTLCAILVSNGKLTRKAMSVGATAAITAVNPILGGVIIGMKILRRATDPGSTSRFFSDNTGGVTVGVKNEEVGRVFIEMMGLLRARYTFGYEPPEQPAGGALRTIKLALNNQAQKQKGETLIYSRRGYYLRKKSQPNQQLALVKSAVAPVNEPPISPSPAPVDRVNHDANPALPELHVINKAMLTPSYGCRPRDEVEKGYQGSALFLSEFSRQRNSPDLLFNGACGAEDFFEVATTGDDLTLITDLGPDASFEEISASQAFSLKQNALFTGKIRVEFNHTYAVLLSKSHLRGLFIFKVTGYIPNERVDLKYAVKQYQVIN